MTTISELIATIQSLLSTLVNAEMMRTAGQISEDSIREAELRMDPDLYADEAVLAPEEQHQRLATLFGNDFVRAWRELEYHHQAAEKFTGEGWAETRRQMGEGVAHLYRCGNLTWRSLIFRLAGEDGMGHWMLNQYLQVLYLHTVHSDHDDDNVDWRAVCEALLENYPLPLQPEFREWSMLFLAPVLCPEEVRVVVESHRETLPLLTQEQITRQTRVREQAVRDYKRDEEIEEALKDFFSQEE